MAAASLARSLCAYSSPTRAGQDLHRWSPSLGTGGQAAHAGLALADPSHPGGRQLAAEEQFRSEILFYQDVHPHLQGLRLPRVYYVAMTDAPRVSAWSYVLFDTRTPLRFCVLMEDLAVEHFEAVPLGASLPFPRANRRSSTSRSCMPSDGSSGVCGRSCTCGRHRGSPSCGRTRACSGGSATNSSARTSSPPSCTAGPSTRVRPRMHQRGHSSRSQRWWPC